jgi:hypothetical protein
MYSFWRAMAETLGRFRTFTALGQTDIGEHLT